MIRQKIKVLACYCFVLATPHLSHAASFNCDGTLNQIETLICESDVLSALDEALISQYEMTKTITYEPALKRDQIAWIKKKQRKCKSEECLVEAYLERIHTLRFWDRGTKVESRWLGHYEKKHSVPIYNSARRDWEDSTEVVDILSLSAPQPDGTIKTLVHTVTTNGHSCTLNGLGRIKGSEIVVGRDLDGTPLNDDCELKIKFSEGQITLLDPDYSCKSTSCGMRAAFHDITFSRFDKTNKEPIADIFIPWR
ncbi:hypothetical protein A8B84_20570 [Marinobacter sp. EhC06]|uniref:lysozyme inhibitor LprI family protein n=1 Tax=Marinobacter TaxID=2742 RepID=UPI0007D9A6F5|nr:MULTISPECIES: lysozyme inhibitor LprI family protein [unclassified Marinobacter]OAN92959.1 hypothetical protein A8B84_20570 [Marinobacter sp. EhC06]OAN93110.1 hypothetical protein A8B80_17885 [Marinobacter sp. EhN04]